MVTIAHNILNIIICSIWLKQAGSKVLMIYDYDSSFHMTGMEGEKSKKKDNRGIEKKDIRNTGIKGGEMEFMFIQHC